MDNFLFLIADVVGWLILLVDCWLIMIPDYRRDGDWRGLPEGGGGGSREGERERQGRVSSMI